MGLQTLGGSIVSEEQVPRVEQRLRPSVAQAIRCQAHYDVPGVRESGVWSFIGSQIWGDRCAVADVVLMLRCQGFIFCQGQHRHRSWFR